ncbi:MAG: hypothetical protein ABR923_16910 [Terracidiphilus sp.]|jgi:hypothetical protein
MSSETERITNQIMNRYNFDRFIQNLSELTLAEWDRACREGRELSLPNPLRVQSTGTARVRFGELLKPPL